MPTPNASTGPRSAEGKARSSMNALKSGIYSKSEIIPGEDPARLTTLTEEYFQRFHPAVPEQRDLVDILVRSTWTLRRLATAEAQVWTYEMERAFELDENSPIGHGFCRSDRTLTRLQRMVNSTQHNFRDALRELERLKSLDLPPNPPEITLVPPRPPTPVPPQPSETEPVTPSPQFVSSSSAPPPPTNPEAAPKAAPKAASNPLPFHKPGSLCNFTPRNPKKYQQCPLCHAPAVSLDD